MIKKTSNINYAKALLETSIEKNILDETFSSIESISNIISENDLIVKSLSLPNLSSKKKIKILEDILKKDFQIEKVKKFFDLIINSNKVNEIKNILSSFIDLYYINKGIKILEIISCSPLSSEKKNDIISKLDLDIKKTIIKENTNKSLVGGFILKYDGKVYDSSIKRKLKNIRNNINI